MKILAPPVILLVLLVANALGAVTLWLAAKSLASIGVTDTVSLLVAALFSAAVPILWLCQLANRGT